MRMASYCVTLTNTSQSCHVQVVILNDNGGLTIVYDKAQTTSFTIKITMLLMK